MISHPYKKVGLFGGSFDPIHNGHLKAAAHILEKLHLEHIYFIPAYLSPFKKEGEVIASPQDRLSMVKKAIEGYEHFAVSELEINKKGVSYTIDTLQHYKQLFSEDSELYFIMGSDAFLEISKWKNLEEIFSLAHMVVVNRPHYQIKPLEDILKNPKLVKEFAEIEPGAEYKHFTGHSIVHCEMDSIDISSSELRELIMKRHPYSSFVPKAVCDYITKQGLYVS